MRIAIFGKSYASGKQDEINTLFSSLQKYSPELLVDREFLRVMQDMDIRLPKITVLSGNDFYADISLSLGGDGTFLKTAERIGDKCIPILGINLGRMGFLADVQSSETEQAIDEIMAGRYHIEERSLLHITDGSRATWPYALNEVAVLKLDTSSMITIHAYLDNTFLNTYQADGLLVATPTGSTGYSLSVGGPIVAPKASNFIITPVAPHSLNVRPLVIGDDAEIRLVAEGRNRHFLVSLDGRSEEKTSGESITLRKAPFPIRVIKRNKQLFTDTLRKKLMWGVDLRSNI